MAVRLSIAFNTSAESCSISSFSMTCGTQNEGRKQMHVTRLTGRLIQ